MYIVLLHLIASGRAEVRTQVQTAAGSWYTPKHPKLFDSQRGPRRGWFDPEFLAAIDEHQKSRGVVDEKLRALLRQEHPGLPVYSFPFLKPHFAQMMLEEAGHYKASGLDHRKANGMNNYGILWNSLSATGEGIERVFRLIQKNYVSPVAKVLFPHLLGPAQDLDHHHSYLVEYSSDMDPEGLDIHHDSCDITLNAALHAGGTYEGSKLVFCGVYGTESYRNYSFTYNHTLGRALIYDGRTRHGALPITKGERTSFVMWSQSSSYRATPQYKRNNIPVHPVAGTRSNLKAPTTSGLLFADPRCVSHHHDDDYCHYRLLGFEKRCGAGGINSFSTRWRKALESNKYWQVGEIVHGQGGVAALETVAAAGTSFFKQEL